MLLYGSLLVVKKSISTVFIDIIQKTKHLLCSIQVKISKYKLSGGISKSEGC